MQVKCTCGKLLNVPDTLAGKSVRCPGCNKVLKVPEAPASAPPAGKILFSCTCGKKLSAPLSAAGKKILCPSCNKELTVPSLAPGAAGASKPATQRPAGLAKPAAAARSATQGQAKPQLSAESDSDLQLEEAKEEPVPAVQSGAREKEDSSTEQYGITGPKCPNCKATLEIGAQFCVECGTNLATGTKVEAVKFEDVKEKRKLDRKTALIVTAAVGGVLVIGLLTFFLVRMLSKKSSAPSAIPQPTQVAPTPTGQSSGPAAPPQPLPQTQGTTPTAP